VYMSAVDMSVDELISMIGIQRRTKDAISCLHLIDILSDPTYQYVSANRCRHTGRATFWRIFT